jgi:hypothetical protein
MTRARPANCLMPTLIGLTVKDSNGDGKLNVAAGDKMQPSGVSHVVSRVRRHEKRLARALLILARYGKNGGAETLVPKVSQETLAELVGTTRSRVNFFMNKFRKLGFIHYNGGIRVHNSLLNVVLHD